jgi:hypothetical protein
MAGTGQGHRRFTEGESVVTLRLTGSKTTPAGVVIATYEASA